MFKKLFFFFAAFLTFTNFTYALTLDFVYPEGEGDASAAAPYLADLFGYVKAKSGLEVQGQYYNDEDEALEALKSGKTDFAVVSPGFFVKYKDELRLDPILKTIPSYADGPYEKYYVLAGENMVPSQYAAQRGAVALYASQSYAADFIETLVKESSELRNVVFNLQQTPQILKALKDVAERKDTAFLLLTGYEYSVLEALKASNPVFTNLKLVYESPEMPSSPLVRVGNAIQQAELSQLKNALIGMGKDSQGKAVLNRMRLSGFAE